MSDRVPQMCGGALTRTDGVLLDPHPFHTTVHCLPHTLPPEEDFGDRQRFFRDYDFKCGFPGLFGAVDPRKINSVVQKIGCLVLRMFCRALAGGFSTLPFLKWVSADFVEGGLVHEVLHRSCGRW